MMTMVQWNVLAKEEGEWKIQLIIFVVVIVIMLLKRLFDWIKSTQQAEQQERSEPPPRRPQAEPPQQRVQPVEEIVRTMRQARRPQEGGQPRQQRQSQPAPVAQAAYQYATPEDLTERHIAPSAVGQGVDAETARLERHLRRQREQTAKRVAGQPVGMLAATGAGSAVQGVRAIVDISLADLDEARRGILYSEILGPPTALRKQQGMWDV